MVSSHGGSRIILVFLILQPLMVFFSKSKAEIVVAVPRVAHVE